MAGYLNRKGETAKTRMQCEKMIEVTPATKKTKKATSISYKTLEMNRFFKNNKNRCQQKNETKPKPL